MNALKIGQTKKGLALFAKQSFIPGDMVFHELASGFLAVVNHSCDPNCRIELLTVLANKPIFRGDEITLDYSTIGFSTRPLDFNCLCGSPSCRGRINKPK